MSKSVLVSEYFGRQKFVPNDEISAITGAMINNLMFDEPVPKEKLAEITLEEEFDDLTEPKDQLIKMTKKKFVDSFFENGTIRLGTFRDFAQSENNEIGDKSEGSLIVVGRDSQMTGFARIASGFNNFVFCTYIGKPDPELIQNFEYDDYYIINDPEGFANAIADRLACPTIYRSGCLYRTNKVLVGTPPPNFDFYSLSAELRNLVNKSQYFIKPLKFKPQREYRFIWELDEDVDDPFVFNCPEAIKYCSRGDQ